MHSIYRDLCSLAESLGFNPPETQGDGHVRFTHPQTGGHVVLSRTAYDGTLRKRYVQRLYRAAGVEREQTSGRYKAALGRSGALSLDGMCRRSTAENEAADRIDELQTRHRAIAAELMAMRGTFRRATLDDARRLAAELVDVRAQLAALHQPVEHFDTGAHG